MDVNRKAETDVFFNPRRLGHINIWADDYKRSENFYSDVCGFHVEFWEPDLKASFVGTGNTPHDVGMVEVTHGKARYGRDGLLQIPEGVGMSAGLNHLAWELENEKDLVDGCKRLEENDIPILMTVDHQIAHSVYLFDPDGNQIEFYCDTVKDWRNMIQGEQSLLTSHWNPGETEPFTEGRYEANPELRHVEHAKIHPTRLTHAVLETHDMDRLVKFYQTVGGMVLVHEASDGSVACLRGSHDSYVFHLAICRADAPSYHHSSFEIADEAAVEDAETRLRAANYEI